MLYNSVGSPHTSSLVNSYLQFWLAPPGSLASSGETFRRCIPKRSPPTSFADGRAMSGAKSSSQRSSYASWETFRGKLERFGSEPKPVFSCDNHAKCMACGIQKKEGPNDGALLAQSLGEGRKQYPCRHEEDGHKLGYLPI